MRSALAAVLLALTTAAAGAQDRPDTARPPVPTSAPASGAGQSTRPGAARGADAERRVAASGVGSVARAVEIDHVYLWTRPGAPEAAALRAVGLRVADEPTHHTGDGTSSVGVMFENMYLELLYPDTAVSDRALLPAERLDRSRRLRWRASGAPPIGVGLRRLAGAPDALPFPTASRAQPWMRPGTALRFATTPADSLAPEVFVVPRYMALPAWVDQYRRDPASAAWWRHPLGVRRVTDVRVVVARPEGIPSPLHRLNDAGVVPIERGAGPLLVLTLDGGGRGVAKDLRPELPLVVRY